MLWCVPSSMAFVSCQAINKNNQLLVIFLRKFISYSDKLSHGCESIAVDYGISGQYVTCLIDLTL